jgi:hypothetical protein
VDEQAARIARLEADVSSAADPSAHARKVLEDLKAITDGNRTMAVQDALTELVRVGDPAVPDIVALLESGLEREYGGRFAVEGNAVASYPGLRMVLLDALRQIGTKTATDGMAQALSRSEHIADFRVVLLCRRPDADVTDPSLVAALSSTASRMLRKIAAEGIDLSADAPDNAASSVLWWIMTHPSQADVPAVEELVLHGRPKSAWGYHVFEVAYGTLAQLAPEKAVQATQTLHFSAGETLNLSGYLPGLTPAGQVRYYEALLTRPDFEAHLRSELYSRLQYFSDTGKDPARRAAEVQPIVRFLEARAAAETDASARSAAEQALAQLRAAIERALK